MRECAKVCFCKTEHKKQTPCREAASVFGISVDSVFTLAKYKEEQQYNFPLLSDFNKEVSAAYGSLYQDWILNMRGVSKRSAFVIDKEGVVRYAEVLEIIRPHVSCEVKPRRIRLKLSSLDKNHPFVQAGISLGRKTYGSPTRSD